MVLPAPAAPIQTGPGIAGALGSLRFADRLDGFAFGIWNGSDVGFYVTHDGASSWRAKKFGAVLAFATSGGMAYVVAAQCGSTACSSYRLWRSPVASDTWTSEAVPVVPSAPNIDLVAHGAALWVMAPTQSSSNRVSLARSTDHGQNFRIGLGPCQADLGGSLEPSSYAVVWAVCPTGMLADVHRSVDGGVTFRIVRAGDMTNGAQIAPASDTTAVLAPNVGKSGLLLTTDGGATWSPTAAPSDGFWNWIGFTDATTGAGLQVASDPGTNRSMSVLWRTLDGGLHWRKVPL